VNVFSASVPSAAPMDARPKYKEALSATQAICSELADIDEDNNFREHLKFLLDQWHNVRQRKRIRSSHSGESKTEHDQPAQQRDLSPAAAGRPRTRSISLLNRPSEVAQGDEKSGGGVAADNPSPSQPSDSSQLLQVHSLFSEELGRVAIMSTTSVQFVAPSLFPGRGLLQPDPTENTSAARASTTDEDDDFKPDPRSTLHVHFNPKAAKSGRPKLDRKLREAEDKQKRHRFNASEEHRQAMCDITLVQLADAQAEEKPALEEALQRVTPIPVKFDKAVNKKSKLVVQVRPVLNENAFYVLPTKLLDKCMAVLPLKNTAETAIVIASQNQPSNDASQTTTAADTEMTGQDTDTTECVAIADAGRFSR